MRSARLLAARARRRWKSDLRRSDFRRYAGPALARCAAGSRGAVAAPRARATLRVHTRRSTRSRGREAREAARPLRRPSLPTACRPRRSRACSPLCVAPRARNTTRFSSTSSKIPTRFSTRSFADCSPTRRLFSSAIPSRRSTDSAVPTCSRTCAPRQDAGREPLNLDTNHRSEEPLVEAVNALFSQHDRPFRIRRDSLCCRPRGRPRRQDTPHRRRPSRARMDLARRRDEQGHCGRDTRSPRR